MKQQNDLENNMIRSNKVRKIMEEKPFWFIRYGTIIIAVSLIAIYVVISQIFNF